MRGNPITEVVKQLPFKPTPDSFSPSPHISVAHKFMTNSLLEIKLSKFSISSLEASFLWEICAKSAKLCSSWRNSRRNALSLYQLERDGLQGASLEGAISGLFLVSKQSRRGYDHSNDEKQHPWFQNCLDQ